MANKFVALLLVVCLVAAAGVDAIDERTMKCMDSCVTYQCGENPSTFCTILCKLGCATSSGLANANMVLAEAPESSWAEAPLFSRKVKA